MKKPTKHVSVALFFILVLVLICPSFGSGTSTDILIEKSGTVMSWTDAHIDNNLVAIYVSTDSPPAIRVYFMNGTLYKSVPLSGNTVNLESLAFSDCRVYFTEHNRDDIIYQQNETVYQYTLATGERRKLYTGFDGERITKIASSGDHVVLRGGSGERSLILHTLSTGSNQIIFTSRNWITDVNVDGDHIMWGCERVDKGPGREIHVYTISTGTDYVIPESRSVNTDGYGDISGDNVVWVMRAKDPYYINGVPVGGVSYDMKLMNLGSGTTQSIERSDTSPITVPFISGDTVAWVKKPTLDYNNSDTGIIRTYNLTTGKFADFAANVDAISDFDHGVVLWSRLDPVSFWVTPLSGDIPEMTLATPVSTAGKVFTTVPQSTASQKSPVDPGLAVAVLAAGGTAYSILHRKR